jgi:hypothetical protein
VAQGLGPEFKLQFCKKKKKKMHNRDNVVNKHNGVVFGKCNLQGNGWTQYI